jgi:lysine-specific permease
MTAAASEDPGKDIPIAIRQVFWRILMFSVLSIGIVACLIPYTYPNLTGADDTKVTESPFTTVLAEVGTLVAVHIMNAIILSA